MSQTPSTVCRSVLDSKSALARLMAEENIIVEHMPDAQTAYFDVEARRLVLPVWQDMNESIYDMLVAHEVGHALFTPDGDALKRAVQAIDPNNADVAKGYLNVVEDARIEKLMKRRYRGLVHDFRKAYKTIWERDMFGLKTAGVEPNKASLIDRLNIKAKCGVHTDLIIQLDVEDEILFSEMMATETFDEVVEVAKRAYQLAKEKKRNKPQSAKSLPSPNDDDSFSKDVQSSFDENSDNGEGEGEAQAEATSDEQGDAPSAGTNSTNSAPEESITSSALQRTVDSMRDVDATEVGYYDLPAKVDASKFVTNFRQIAIDLASVNSETTPEWTNFVSTVMPQVRMMAKEFELRKAADAFARTTVAKTGKLDVGQLHRYRFSEDIFLRSNIVHQGKSHGMVMLVDWSSSMDGVLESTVKQVITLAMFCRLAKIPFSVYSFNDRSANDQKTTSDREINITNLSLLNWLTTDMSKQEFNRMASLFLAMGKMNTRTCACKSIYYTGGTPLQQAIVALRYILPEFRQRTGVQVLNTIILTDGEDSNGLQTKSRAVNSYAPVTIRDRISGCQVSFANAEPNEKRTGKLLDLVRTVTDANTVGFFLIPGGNYGRSSLARYSNTRTDSPDFERALAEFRDNKFYEVSSLGYNTFFLLPCDKLDIELTAKEDFVTKNLTKGRIAGAFTKAMNTRAVNRVLLRRFIEQIVR